ncbi:hypothetical protein C8Q75DRAFT_214916 [Abortiporus biennis]|nr:hypothetical protein C8Q75DRAFT_214916 [Abortiporus biennis]
MENQPEERPGRSLGSRIVQFLSRSRSRSRSKKRRSRSMDAIPAADVPALPSSQPGSLRIRHARHASLTQTQDTTTTESSSTVSTLHSKPLTRIKSRPLSSTTTATHSTITPLPPSKKIRNHEMLSNRHYTLPTTADVHLETEILPPPNSASTSSSDNSKTKVKKMSIFSMAIPAPNRKTSNPESKSSKLSWNSKSQSRPSSPAQRPSTANAGRKSLTPTPPSGRRQHTDSSVATTTNTPNPNLLLATPHHQATLGVHVLNSPPHLSNRGDQDRRRVRRPSDAEVDSGDFGGRCSPLFHALLPGSSGDKGKEKERARSSSVQRKGKEKEKERDYQITGPKRVGSPVLRERDRESRSRSAVGHHHAAVGMEKVPSGGARRSASVVKTDHTGTASSTTGTASHPHPHFVNRPKQIKHGSFDFERPMSTIHRGEGSGPVNMKTALREMGIGPSTVTPSTSAGIGMQRSTSLKGYSRSKALPSTPGDSYGSSSSKGKNSAVKPYLDHIRTTPSTSRRGTDDSTGSKSTTGGMGAIPDMLDSDPISPTTTHSGNSSSWGRSAGKNALLKGIGAPRISTSNSQHQHGAFKFEPAVPPIPGSPASDEVNNRGKHVTRASNLGPNSGLKQSTLNNHSPSRSTSPTPVGRQGRSLDLGLGLTWAPTKVREEAVLSYGGSGRSSGNNSNGSGSWGRSKPRWRGGGVDEEGRLGQDYVGVRSGAASDVAEAFKEALGERGFGVFKTYVHRFDAHAIPLDGPYGLVTHAKRLLDDSSGLDERGKRKLMERFIHFVQENQ